MVKKEYSAVKDTFEGVTDIWFKLVAKTKTRKSITTSLLLLLLLFVIVMRPNIFFLLVVVFKIISVRYAFTTKGRIFFYASLGILILISYILWIIPLAIGIYLLYAFLNELRIRRIQRIAKMSPSQLSGVKYQKPEVEIIVRGGRR